MPPGPHHVALDVDDAFTIRRNGGHVNAIAVFQLTYADIDLANFPPQPPGSILPLFAQLGIVDIRLQAKPALATYDSVFARPLVK